MRRLQPRRVGRGAEQRGELVAQQGGQQARQPPAFDRFGQSDWKPRPLKRAAARDYSPCQITRNAAAALPMNSGHRKPSPCRGHGEPVQSARSAAERHESIAMQRPQRPQRPQSRAAWPITTIRGDEIEDCDFMVGPPPGALSRRWSNRRAGTDGRPGIHRGMGLVGHQWDQVLRQLLDRPQRRQQQSDPPGDRWAPHLIPGPAGPG